MAVMLNQAKEKVLLLRRDPSASGKLAISKFTVGDAPRYTVNPAQVGLVSPVQIGSSYTKAVAVLAAYSTSTTYDVGDLTIYNNEVYKCVTSTTGTFDPTAWSDTGMDATRRNIFVCTLTESECAGHSLTEIGLVDADNLVTCIKTFSAKEKTDEKQMVFYISDRWEEDDG